MSNRIVRRMSGQRKMIIAVAAVIILVIGIIASMLIFYGDGASPDVVDTDQETSLSREPMEDAEGVPDLSEQDDSGASRYEEVSYATMQRLDEGTILSFGDLNATNSVSIVADPSMLSSEGVYGGNELIDAVENRSFRLNLYLSPETEERSGGVDSMIKTATCLIGIDEQDSNVTTLRSIMAASESFTGIEDLTEMSTKMGADPDIQCSETATESALSTSNNALHFMTHFRADSPNIVVNSTGAIIGATDLKEDWVPTVISDGDINNIIVGS